MVSLNDQGKSMPYVGVTGGAKEGAWFQKYPIILTDFLPMRKAVLPQPRYAGRADPWGWSWRHPENGVLGYPVLGRTRGNRHKKGEGGGLMPMRVDLTGTTFGLDWARFSPSNVLKKLKTGPYC